MTPIDNRLRLQIADAISKYGDYQFTIEGYRRRSDYSLDLVVAPGYSLEIPAEMPSEPPEGLTYQFGDTGFDILHDKAVTAGGKIMDTHGAKPKHGAVALIPTPWKNVRNYCHWMVSELPYLFLAFQSVHTAGTELIVIPDEMQDATSPFARETFEALHRRLAPGVPVVPLGSVGRLSAKRFFIPYNNCSYAGERKVHQAWYAWYHSSRATAYALDCMRRLFAEEAGGVPAGSGGKIYIARKTRTLKNEADVRNLLTTAGFEIVTLEDLPVREQARLFRSADTVVGMHGAGLTNFGFCREGTRVIELADPEDVAPLYREGVWIPGLKATRTHYHIIAATRGLDYSCIETPDKSLSLRTLGEAIDAPRTAGRR